MEKDCGFYDGIRTRIQILRATFKSTSICFRDIIKFYKGLTQCHIIMWLLFLFGFLFGIDLAIHLYSEYKIFKNNNYTKLIRYITKPFLLLFILLFYLSANEIFSGWLIAALGGGWIGDLMLMMPDPKNTKKFFKIGLISFLLGHICYIIAFLNFLESFAVIPWSVYLLNLMLAIYGIWIAKILLPHVGALKGPIIFYIIVIITMAITASWLISAGDNHGYFILLIGTVSFVISDTINAYNRFVKQIPYERLYTMTTYALGQFLIILGVIVAF